MLQFDDNNNDRDILKRQWRSFCDFHVGKYKQALDEYQNQASLDNIDVGKNEVTVNMAVCMFYLGYNRFSSFCSPLKCKYFKCRFFLQECMPNLKSSLNQFQTAQ